MSSAFEPKWTPGELSDLRFAGKEKANEEVEVK